MSWDTDLSNVKRLVGDFQSLLGLQAVLERLAKAEHAIKQAEQLAAVAVQKQAEIAALDVKYAERVRALAVDAEQEKQRLAEALDPLKASLKQVEGQAKAETAKWEAKTDALRQQVGGLTIERDRLSREVDGLAKKQAELETAWEKVRQKVGAA